MDEAQLIELRRIRQLEEIQVCFHIAELRRSDWQECMMKDLR